MSTLEHEYDQKQDQDQGTRCCEHCGGPLRRHKGESAAYWEARRYCGQGCANRGRHAAAWAEAEALAGTCNNCGRPLKHRAGETRAALLARRFCSRSCASLHRDAVAAVVAHQFTGDERRIDHEGRLEDLAWLLDTGETATAIPARLGLAPESLAAWLKQIGRRDLWTRLVEQGRRERYAEEALSRDGWASGGWAA